MMKISKKFLALGLSVFILSPSLAFADDIVYYDKTSLDEVFTNNGFSYDKNEVKKRYNKEVKTQRNLSKSTDIAKPTSKEEIKDIGKEIKKDETLKLQPKTAIYSNVVDISEHQNPVAIDYDKFARDIDGAILRSSITTFKEDEETGEKSYYLRKDLTVDKHYQELNKRDVPIGFYHYSRAINEEEALKEANFVLAYIRDKTVSLPIFIDIEDNLRQAKASKKDLSNVANTFVTALRRNGYVAGIYSYPHFAKNHLTKEVRNKSEFWIADYKGKDFSGYTDSDFAIWQYTSSGKVNGYSGRLDKNVLYKDYPLITQKRSKKEMDQLVTEILDGRWSYGKEREKRLTYAGYNYKLIQEEVNKRSR